MTLDYEAGFRAGKRDAHKAMERRIAETVAAERERCAKMLDASAIRADEQGAHWGGRYAKCWAAAIREGGEHG